jgi:hypothetical protein
VVRKLGTPAEDRWQSETGAIQFRSLSYPQRGYFVILMGDARPGARYIGAMDQNWNPTTRWRCARAARRGHSARLKKF